MLKELIKLMEEDKKIWNLVTVVVLGIIMLILTIIAVLVNQNEKIS